MRATAIVVTVVALAACSGGRSDASVDEDLSIVPLAAQAPSSVGPEWFAASRALDLTGDSVADTLLLVAQGRHVDSLVVHLFAHVGVDTLLLAAWDAAYMLVDPPDSARAPGPSREAFVRSQLASTLEEARVTAYTKAPALASWPVLSAEPMCNEGEPECLLASIVRAAGEATREDIGDAWKLAVLADLTKPGRSALTFSYGYESTEVYVWSPLAKRFLLVFSCC